MRVPASDSSAVPAAPGKPIDASGSSIPTPGEETPETPLTSPAGPRDAAPAPPRTAPAGASAAVWLAVLVGWSSLIGFYNLGGGAGLDPPDAWVAQTVREMRESRDWHGYVIPHFSGEIRLHKSPGPYWAVALASWLRGGPVDEVSARIPSALAAVGLSATIFWLTLRIAGLRPAVFAGFASASSLMFLYWSHRAASDLGVTTLMTVSLACLWIGSETHPPGPRRTALWLLGYFAAGLAMLYKMPMALVCVVVPAALYVILCRRWSLLASRWHVAGAALFLLPWLPWVLTVLSVEPAAWDKWYVEFVDRATGDLPNVESQRGDWKLYLLYPAVAFVFTLPYSLSLPQALARGFRSDPAVHARGRAFLLIWFFALLAFFTAATGKETRYFLPAIPPLFVLLGIELSRFFDARRVRPRWARAGVWCLIGVAPLVAVVVGVLLHRVSERAAPYGVYPWSEIGPGYVLVAGVMVAGLVLTSWLYARLRTEAAFATLVGTMWCAFLAGWPTLVRAVAAEAPSRDMAAQLRELDPQYRARLRQVAQQDPRIIWYSDVRFLRIMNPLDLLARQGGHRSRERESRIVGEEMVRQLGSEDLVLMVASAGDYFAFHLRAPQELARAGHDMPRTYVWLTTRVGRPDHRYIVFGNQPPPWPEPRQALDAILERIARKQATGAE
jgi:4-amino-4-deoxy-L-arabinose transferase-like glycosyltransferase